MGLGNLSPSVIASLLRCRRRGNLGLQSVLAKANLGSQTKGLRTALAKANLGSQTKGLRTALAKANLGSQTKGLRTALAKAKLVFLKKND